MGDVFSGIIKAFEFSPSKAPVKFVRRLLEAQGRRLRISPWEVLKTYAFFDRTMRTQTRQYYNSQIDAFEFLGRMFELIEDQYRRAFNEGLNSVGYKQELTPEMQSALDGRVQQEYEHLLNYAQDIEDARGNEDPSLDTFYARVATWANRYYELVTMGAMMGGQPQDLYRWEYGATEKHCSTCAALNGIIATKDDWDASGLRPQSAPNSRLECGGWRCDCRLNPILNAVPTVGGIPNV